MAKVLMSCLGYLSVLAACGFTGASEIQITFKALKSDLDWILKYPTTPLTASIEYTEGAVLHMTVLPNPGGLPGKYIKFDDTLTIKLSTGSHVRKSDFIYKAGSFGFPSNLEVKASLIITPEKNRKPKPAQRTITYTSMQQLTTDLLEETNDMKNAKFYENTEFIWPYFKVGSSTNYLSYKNDFKYFVFKKPFKGISWKGEAKRVDKIFEHWYKLDPQYEQFCWESESDSSDDDSQYGIERQLNDVFFDVWYDPKRGRYGSSSGSMGCIDAVRVYEEWSQESEKVVPTSQKQLAPSRGENLRRKMFQQDMNTAYQIIHSDRHPYKNVIINYADEIVLDVRGGNDGDSSYVSATGITKNGAQGGKANNIRAFYDQDKLEYSDQVLTNEVFVPGNYGEESWYLKYIDWGTFQSHLKAIETAMQRGCEGKKQIYDFSIYYGDCIRVKYFCKSRTVTVIDTILVLMEMTNVPKAALTKCKKVQYQWNFGIESSCLSNGMTPIAIQLEPERMWTQYPKPLIINAEVFQDEMRMLSGILIKKGKPTNNKELSIGTVLIDGRMLFAMEVPDKGATSNSYMNVYGDFTQMKDSGNYKHQKIYFHDGEFTTAIGETIKMNNIFSSGGNVVLPSDKLLKQVVIGWNYLSKGLLVRRYLRKVLDEAEHRCGPKIVKNLRFELILNDTFGLSGFCDCSERVILVQGKFRALLLTKTDQGTEVRSHTYFEDFVYVDKDQLLIIESGNLNEVFAISLPEVTNFGEIRKLYGAPVKINDNAYILFKSNKD